MKRERLPDLFSRERLDWDGICVCGKKEMDGIKCRFGATHMTLEASQAAYAALQAKVSRPTIPSNTRERL